MSLILEALRKSEAERQRGRMPDVHAELPPLGTARVSSTATWPWLAGGLVLLAGATAAWSMLGAGGATNARTGDVPARATPTIAHDALPPLRHLTRAAAPAAAQAKAPRADTTPASVASPAAPSPRTATPRPLPAAATPVQSIGTSPSPVAPAVSEPLPPPPAADAGATVMTLADLAPAQRKALPPLKLSMHMWNDDPSQRFVILDGTRVGEGDRVGDAVVRAITRDGVLLDWQGRALKVPMR